MKKLEKSILAHGESGNTHCLTADVDIFELEDGTREFELEKETDLTHEEHKTISLPGSTAFHSGIVREWDFFEQEARKVED